MPFHPLPDTSPKKPNASDFGLFIVRFISAAAFVYYQLAAMLSDGKSFVWEKAEWTIVTQLMNLNLPFPGILSVTFVLLFTISLLGVTLGIFTRINGIVLFALTAITFFIPLDLSTALTPQALVLYLALFLALACGGAGRVSLDYLLAGRKRKMNT